MFGEFNWLLNMIAPTREATISAIANFKQVVKEGDLYPLVTRLVGKEMLAKKVRSAI